MDPQRAQELLGQARTRIEGQLRSLEPVLADHGTEAGRDSGDAGSELFEEERDAGIAEALRERLAAIERAERRLAAGTYGRSIQSGDPIPDERLEFDPAVELTVEEQGKLESGG